MNTDLKRVEVSKVYPGPKWAQKVKNMTDNQVIAIFLRFQRDGKL